MHPNADNLIASRFDTVIYDLDGTLIDSARDMCVAVSRVLADHGLPPISDQDARIFMGQGSKITMGKAFAKNGRTLDDVALSAATREFVRYYEADPISNTVAFDGVAEVVTRFSRLGLRQGVCTNKFERPARIILEHLKLMPPISDVAGADTFPVRKPDPRHIL
ncbi:MAG: HAD hydrolase-like protein, partial [Reyranella sp.]|nr:HAD hydrolase-like protein [Reyranella sp.]